MLDFVFCGSELTDSWKRTKLNGKVSDLPDRISSVLNVPLSNINVDGYICNERSYRDLKRLGKILEDAKFLQPQSLKEKFTTNNRTKRCVPSDSRILPSVSGPSKSLHHVRWFKGGLSVLMCQFLRQSLPDKNLQALT